MSFTQSLFAPVSSSCPVDIAPLSSSCPSRSVLVQPKDAGADLHHAFEAQDLDEGRRNGCGVIVAHGLDGGIENHSPELLAIEFAPVHVSVKSALTGLATDTLRGILSGQIERWEDAGGDPGDIHLYLHGGSLQRRKFLRLVELFGVARSLVEKLDATLASDYAKLAFLAGADPAALVIGL